MCLFVICASWSDPTEVCLILLKVLLVPNCQVQKRDVPHNPTQWIKEKVLHNVVGFCSLTHSIHQNCKFTQEHGKIFDSLVFEIYKKKTKNPGLSCTEHVSGSLLRVGFVMAIIQPSAQWDRRANNCLFTPCPAHFIISTTEKCTPTHSQSLGPR